MGSEFAPVPVSAVYTPGSPSTITITFDTPLRDDTLDSTRWSARYNDKTQTILTAVAIGWTAVLQVQDGAADIGADVVSYDDAAADVRSLVLQIPAVTFNDFPIT